MQWDQRIVQGNGEGKSSTLQTDAEIDKVYTEHKGPCELVAYCDSDYAGDNDTRKSTTGYIMTLNRVTICYKSKGQNIVTLSSTEAEFIAMTEATSDILFIKQIMDFWT